MTVSDAVPENQKGGALVELALALPILVLVLFGLLEFGYLMYAKGVIANASREGARYGVVLSSPRRTRAEVEARVREYLHKSGFNDPVDITFPNFPNTPEDVSGAPLTVRVEYEYRFVVLPNFVQSITGPLTLTAETVMHLE